MLFLATPPTTAASAWTNVGATAKPGCRDRCGNITVPYPFGMGDRHCYFDEGFEITCNHSYNLPRPFLQNYDGESEGYEVLLFSPEYIRVNGWAPGNCFENKTGNGTWLSSFYILSEPFTFSYSRNKFTAVGCDIVAYIPSSDTKSSISGCASFCVNQPVMSNLSSCLGGNGCCQTNIPKGLTEFVVKMETINTENRTWISYSCSNAFLVENEFTDFHTFVNLKKDTNAPVIIDWAIGDTNCEEAQRNHSSYACGLNTYCVNSTNGPGYRCSCSKGYRGNPYLPHGCQDIDECKEPNKSPCKPEANCINIEGSYFCVCSHGYQGDGTKKGFGCMRDKRRLLVFVTSAIGTSVFLLLVLVLGFWLYRRLEKRKRLILKRKYFKRNGGLLLQENISSHDGRVEDIKIFFAEELERSTDNFNQNRIIGKGGFGTVYKGMLSDGRIVAVKKSKLVDENQITQFINEVTILSQINHRNIVRLLGCCLETEVPLLVYEFISNGTLSNHLHNKDRAFSISWKDRLRIAAEVAGALAYLHSEASMPIFHRDIKSSNILLDENYRAKVCDFGISRSIPLDKTHLTTIVQGTFGYLDPEYFQSSQFTEKSDVYGFGVVLVELLTGERAVSLIRSEEEKGLAFHFKSSMKNNRLLEILDARVVDEGDKDEILIVAKLAKRCLQLNGNKRPLMKEVATCLDGLRELQKHPLLEDKQKLREDDFQMCDQMSRVDTSGAFETKEFESSSSTFETKEFESSSSI